MIDIALMYMEKLGLLLHGILSAAIDLTVGGLTITILGLFIFYWLIFFFIVWLKDLGNRRG